MAPAFRALSDPSRRLLLDRLFERDGQTLGELCAYLPAMTRFGVMRHLGVLEEAGLVDDPARGAREAPLPQPRPDPPRPRPLDRQVRRAGRRARWRRSRRTWRPKRCRTRPRLFRLHQGLARPRLAGDHRRRRDRAYYYGTRVDSDWSKGGRIVYAYPDGTVAADGEVLDIDPGRLVTMTFHARWDPEIEAEGPVTMTWEIEPPDDGGSKLTVTTSGLVEGTKIAERVQRRHRLHRVGAEDVPRDGRADVGAGRGG